MMPNNSNGQAMPVVDMETIYTLISFPLEKQALVKGFILGLCNQAQNSRPQGTALQTQMGTQEEHIEGGEQSG